MIQALITCCRDMLTTLLVFGYVTVFTAPGLLCCQLNEYTTRDGQCCPKCHEGTVVRKDCTTHSGTRCGPCSSGTFMDKPNGLNTCFPCTSCVPAHGLFTQQNCTATTDAVCDVLSGYFCRSLAEDIGCRMAEKHAKCASGQGIKESGTNRTDTVCEDCKPGYFSQNGVVCKPWTICSETQVKVIGGPSTDVICSGASRNSFFVVHTCLCVCSRLDDNWLTYFPLCCQAASSPAAHHH